MSVDDRNPEPRTDLQQIFESVRQTSARTERERIAVPDLEPYFVEWDGITAELVQEFRDTLDRARTEQEMQRFLSAHPELLVQPLGGGHGRWVIPHKRLDDHYETDYMIAEKSSIGFEWTAVELKGPKHKLFIQGGAPGEELRGALQQLDKYRRYVGENLQRSRLPRSDAGLGLVDIDSDFPAWVIIGRSAGLPARAAADRRRLNARYNVKIRTYDWLVDQAARRSVELGRLPGK